MNGGITKMVAEKRMPRDDEFVMPSLRLDGRAALVTGGSRGLGLGVALALAHAGANVALAARTVEQLEQAAQLVRHQTGCEAIVLPTDIGNMDEVRAMVRKAAEHYGRLDILVNGAGINIRKPPDAFTEADWDQLMNLNLKGVFFACQEAFPIMRSQGKGRIINIGSLSMEISIPNISLYAASKGGMRQMTRALAIEWAKYAITVNAIAPGRFWTALTDQIFSDDMLYESATSVIPMGRPGIPADLAGTAVLLASDAADYITGQTIIIDGGWIHSGGVKG
jgi:NAD(P)-dependent dehydrogenase (short-subunit alcohol dehydrogenase family)